MYIKSKQNTVNEERFAGLNFCVFHSINEYRCVARIIQRGVLNSVDPCSVQIH